MAENKTKQKIKSAVKYFVIWIVLSLLLGSFYLYIFHPIAVNNPALLKLFAPILIRKELGSFDEMFVADMANVIAGIIVLIYIIRVHFFKKKKQE